MASSRYAECDSYHGRREAVSLNKNWQGVLLHFVQHETFRVESKCDHPAGRFRKLEAVP